MDINLMDKELLLKLPLFNGLPIEELDSLLDTVQLQEVQPGKLLFLEGDPVMHFLIILEGYADVIRSMGTPEERLLATVGPGDFLGEMSIFSAKPRRTATARTTTLTRSLLISVDDFMTLLQRQPELAIRLLEELTRRISNNEAINVHNLQEKNRKLSEALQELKQAQALLIEKEKLEHELALARQIQENSLPKTLPEAPGWSLSAFWQPARQVGGDLYDVQLQPDGKMKFLIADVTGKGVPAALVMATTRSILRALMTQVEAPGQVLRTANELLIDETPWHMFVTCFYAVLDTNTGRVRFANAGQNLPYRLTDHGPETLYATGMPLGLFPGSEYREGETFINPGESVLLYSDGIVEAHNPEGEMYENRRFESLLAGLPPGQSPLDAVLSTVQSFVGPAWEQEDDLTMFSIQRPL